jgi:hypothetical protein
MAYNKHAEHIPKGTKVTDSPEAFKKDRRSIQRHIFSCHTAKSFDLLHKLTSEDAKIAPIKLSVEHIF